MSKKILTIAAFAAFVATGCASSYQAPTQTTRNTDYSYQGSPADIVEKAQKALMLEGFQINHVDKSSGLISTGFKNMKLTPAQANCGTTMGIDYLKDNRTDTRVAVNVLVEAESFNVKYLIEGEYKPGSVTQDITLSCVSRGVLEDALARKIKE